MIFNIIFILCFDYLFLVVEKKFRIYKINWEIFYLMKIYKLIELLKLL